VSGPVASVVVPAHQEGARLEACLAAFWPELQAEGWELVVVDDGSSDDTGARAATAGARVTRHERALGVAAARNAGAAATTAPILVFVDADIHASARCLRLLVQRLLDDPEVHATGARPTVSDLNTGWGERLVELRAVLPFDGRGRDIPGFSSFQSECGAIRRATFEQLGGFDERYAGVGMEEFHLGHRMVEAGLQNVLLDEAHYAHHYKPLRARARELTRRTARWVPLLISRRRLESAGAVGTPGEAGSALLSAVILASVAAAPLVPGALPLAVAATAAQAAMERRYLRLALRHHGAGLALAAFPALQLLHWAVALGFAIGLLRLLRDAGVERTRRP